MKTLQSLSLTRLSVLEFGQHIKSILRNLDLLGVGFITNAGMLAYIAQLVGKSAAYDKAMKYLAKSDETAKIAAADVVRDLVLKSMERQLSVYEFTKDASKHDAYVSLNNLFKGYKNMREWNYEEETNGITNFLEELKSAKHAPQVTLLLMDDFVNELEADNIRFTELFDGRTQESVGKETYDVRAMRADMGSVYTTLAEYVLSMSRVENTPEYNNSLQAINTVRKYYADRLVTRPPAKRGETPTPIPPMEP